MIEGEVSLKKAEGPYNRLFSGKSVKNIPFFSTLSIPAILVMLRLVKVQPIARFLAKIKLNLFNMHLKKQNRLL